MKVSFYLFSAARKTASGSGFTADDSILDDEDFREARESISNINKTPLH